MTKARANRKTVAFALAVGLATEPTAAVAGRTRATWTRRP